MARKKKGRHFLISTTPCPGCGANKWYPLDRQPDGTLVDFTNASDISIPLIDVTVDEGMYNLETYDECVNCGIVLR